MAPAGSLHVPRFLSLAFWGGVRGIALWLAIRRRNGARWWLAWLAFGALLPSLVALFVVFPLKERRSGGWEPAILVGALLLNGAWGLGTAAFLRLFGRFLPAVFR